MRLKITDELRVMKIKSNAKFEEELTCCVKNNMGNLTKIDSSTQKSQKLTIHKLLLNKVYNVLAKKVKRSLFHNTEE